MITSIWTKPGEDASVAREIRRQVFCQELGLPEELAWDKLDPYAFHLVLINGEEPVAAGRMTYGGLGVASLSRICVPKRWRNQGIGDGLVKIMDFKAAQMGMKISRVEAPPELHHFYQRIGFSPAGEPRDVWGYQLTPMEKETNDGSKENCAH